MFDDEVGMYDPTDMLWNTPESFHSACFIYSHVKTTEAEPSADEHIYIQLFKIKAERSVLL